MGTVPTVIKARFGFSRIQINTIELLRSNRAQYFAYSGPIFFPSAQLTAQLATPSESPLAPLSSSRFSQKRARQAPVCPVIRLCALASTGFQERFYIYIKELVYLACPHRESVDIEEQRSISGSTAAPSQLSQPAAWSNNTRQQSW